MLLFIENTCAIEYGIVGFNTSHVTLYQGSKIPLSGCQTVSIHLMLLFIENVSHEEYEELLFQYISCYSLSFPIVRHSIICLVSIHLMLLFISSAPFSFQYISCYSLSYCHQYREWHKARFNTSHVTLYPDRGGRQHHGGRFNTSHVTLYQSSETTSPEIIRVSIHLMLLFIAEAPDEKQHDFVFQYISCYSLSRRIRQTPESCVVSIHLMLLFIHTHLPSCRSSILFQYISCYSLSICSICRALR